MPWAQLWRGHKYCLKKIKISDLHFLQSLFCAPYNRLLHSCVDTAPLSKALRGRVASAPPRIVTKLWYCNTTRHSLSQKKNTRLPYLQYLVLFMPKKMCFILKEIAVWSCNVLCDILQDLQLGQPILCINYDNFYLKKRFYLNKSWWCLLCRRSIYSVRS